MRVLIQCVKNASVSVNGEKVSAIGKGELLFVGFKTGDSKEVVEKMIQKIMKLRIFADENGMTNLSLNQIGGEMLAVSQFTLYADVKDGNRPSFVNAMKPDEARGLFSYFQDKLKESFPSVQFGIFQAMMDVELLNDGPFTIWLDSEELGYGK
ncbi:MAG: D-aminoacyl-tRNA deacylase [Bacilli bacterium]|jgi:D-tyrosyl-tRNA(Tyr) deacylase|nr:D-aminoacyl-tRNA deacylase [Bacilli bacterium]